MAKSKIARPTSNIKARRGGNRARRATSSRPRSNAWRGYVGRGSSAPLPD